ncbi:hypothetical protein FNH22_15410 [Fulvivirga sp. M361]|uniref:hypothetical protein n=1 Tax=Fulvivirga sp. M361 TaxID=2594266 RepID=UPI0011799255|nr:hypothetical protein [Fulvivirga sp. M361]TRX57793.1 hypothetical protein FNH22_15410 [Fulvivirga sp. M361]
MFCIQLSALYTICRANERLIEVGFVKFFRRPTFTDIKPTIDNELSPGARSSGDFLLLMILDRMISNFKELSLFTKKLTLPMTGIVITKPSVGLRAER